MQIVDGLFSSLSKGSTYYIPRLLPQVDQYTGTTIAISWPVADTGTGLDIITVMTDAGISAANIAGEVKITGDLAHIARAALGDADAAYHSGDQYIVLHGMDARQALHTWWQAFREMERYLRQQGQVAQAKFLKAVMTGALEPSYNYYGIQAQSVRDQPFLTAGLLLFYLLYTILWGSAISYLLKAVGITTNKAGKKQEV